MTPMKRRRVAEGSRGAATSTTTLTHSHVHASLLLGHACKSVRGLPELQSKILYLVVCVDSNEWVCCVSE